MQLFTAREYLKIDIANSYGLDKLDWDERIAWFDQHENQLDEIIQKAKEPALFYAGVQAWRDVLTGKPIGYMISLDATSSGLQFLAALTGDRRASQLCNVVDTGKREDAYKGIYQAMLGKVQDTAKIDREMAKDAVMTSLYGSKAMPKAVFGEGKLLDVFYDTMKEEAPAAWELNELFLDLWNPNALSHDWVLPDNFHVHVKVMTTVKETVHMLNEPFDVYYSVNQAQDQGRSLGANTIHSIDGMVVREMARRCDYDPEKIDSLCQAIVGNKHGTRWENGDDYMVATLWGHYEKSGYLSARILDHLCEENLGWVDPVEIAKLISSLPKKPFKVISIHDCFRCLPHYANDLRKQYNNQLHLIARSNMLQFLISQLIGRSVSIGKLDPDLHKDILETNYALS